jgi:hypothetical protein
MLPSTARISLKEISLTNTIPHGSQVVTGASLNKILLLQFSAGAANRYSRDIVTAHQSIVELIVRSFDGEPDAILGSPVRRILDRAYDPGHVFRV